MGESLSVVTIERFASVNVAASRTSLPLHETDDAQDVYSFDGTQARKRPGIGIVSNVNVGAVQDLVYWSKPDAIILSVPATGNSTFEYGVNKRRQIELGNPITFTLTAVAGSAGDITPTNEELIPTRESIYKVNTFQGEVLPGTIVLGTLALNLRRLIPTVYTIAAVSAVTFELKTKRTPGNLTRQFSGAYHQQTVFASVADDIASGVYLARSETVEGANLIREDFAARLSTVPTAKYQFTNFDAVLDWEFKSNNFVSPVGVVNRCLGFKSQGGIMYISTNADLWYLVGTTRPNFKQERMARVPGGCYLGYSAVDEDGLIIAPATRGKSGPDSFNVVNMMGIAGLKAEHIGDPIAPLLQSEMNITNGIPTVRPNASDRMYGDYWREKNISMWFLRRQMDPPLFTGQVNQDVLVHSKKTGGWWKWVVNEATPVNIVKNIDDSMILGCNDGTLRNFIELRGVDMVSATSARPINSRIKTPVLSSADGRTISLEEIEIEGEEGWLDPLARFLTSNPVPGPEATVEGRSDFKDWKLLGKVLLRTTRFPPFQNFRQPGRPVRFDCRGKLDAGRFIEVRVLFATDYARQEVHRLRLGIMGLGENIPKD